MTHQTFPNGLPEPESEVEVKTVWDDDWRPMKFAAHMNNPWHPWRRYDWFGVYAKPSETCAPIVTEWRYPETAI